MTQGHFTGNDALRAETSAMVLDKNGRLDTQLKYGELETCAEFRSSLERKLSLHLQPSIEVD